MREARFSQMVATALVLWGCSGSTTAVNGGDGSTGDTIQAAAAQV